MRKVDDGEKKEKKKEKKGKKEKRKKIRTFIVATNVVASRPPERWPTGTPHARANIIHCHVNFTQKWECCPISYRRTGSAMLMHMKENIKNDHPLEVPSFCKAKPQFLHRNIALDVSCVTYLLNISSVFLCYYITVFSACTCLLVAAPLIAAPVTYRQLYRHYTHHTLLLFQILWSLSPWQCQVIRCH